MSNEPIHLQGTSNSEVLWGALRCLHNNGTESKLCNPVLSRATFYLLGHRVSDFPQCQWCISPFVQTLFPITTILWRQDDNGWNNNDNHNDNCHITTATSPHVVVVVDNAAMFLTTTWPIRGLYCPLWFHPESAGIWSILGILEEWDLAVGPAKLGFTFPEWRLELGYSQNPIPGIGRKGTWKGIQGIK